MSDDSHGIARLKVFDMTSIIYEVINDMFRLMMIFVSIPLNIMLILCSFDWKKIPFITMKADSGGVTRDNKLVYEQ